LAPKKLIYSRLSVDIKGWWHLCISSVISLCRFDR